MLALEHSGWKREQGTSLLSRPAEAAFARAAFAQLDGRVRFFELAAGDRSAAIGSVICAGDSAFLFKTAYDQQLGRHGPGQQLAAATIDALRDRALVDSCAAPDAGYVNELMPDRREIVSLAFPRVPGYGAALRAIARRS